MEDPTEEISLNAVRDLMAHPQYVNANHAIWSMETDKGGLSLTDIWAETDFMCEEMLKTNDDKRCFLVPNLYEAVKKHVHAKGSACEERSTMCCLMLFALRLITAGTRPDSTPDECRQDNPHYLIIHDIARLLGDKMKQDETRRKEMQQLLSIIDRDGDENEARGVKVPFGTDILAGAPDWSERLRTILQTYADKADPLIDRSMNTRSDALWEQLARNTRAATEMRTPTLGKDYNLKLIFNVYALLSPDFYNSSCKGAQSIARVVGENPLSKGKNKHYDKNYFNKNTLDEKNSAFKSEDFLNHVKGIIETIEKHQ